MSVYGSNNLVPEPFDKLKHVTTHIYEDCVRRVYSPCPYMVVFLQVSA